MTKDTFLNWAVIRTRQTAILYQYFDRVAHRTLIQDDFSSVQCWTDNSIASKLCVGRIPASDLDGILCTLANSRVCGYVSSFQRNPMPGYAGPILEKCLFLPSIGQLHKTSKTWHELGGKPPWLKERMSTEKWTLQGTLGYHLASAPTDAGYSDWHPTQDVDLADYRLLFPPAVLSRLMLNDLSQTLLGSSGPPKSIPCSITSYPTYHGVDLEGVISTILHYSNGIFTIQKPMSVVDAAINHRLPSGHVGPNGFTHNYLVVDWNSHNQDHENTSPGFVAVDARILAGPQTAIKLVVLLQNNERICIQVGSLATIYDLLMTGRWVGPWQMGVNGWISRWLSLSPTVLREGVELCP